MTSVSSAPVVEVIPHYSYSSNELTALTTKFNQVVSLLISLLNYLKLNLNHNLILLYILGVI